MSNVQSVGVARPLWIIYYDQYYGWRIFLRLTQLLRPADPADVVNPELYRFDSSQVWFLQKHPANFVPPS
jgi:hypothetical protein